MAAEMTTYALVVGGERLKPVDAEEAQRIVDDLAIVVAENEGKLLNEVNLGCRSYREDGVAILAQFLTQELVKNVTIVKLDDMIAGVQTDPALRILEAICALFAHCTLKYVDLSDNALGNRGLEACDAVLGQQTELELVKFEDNGLAAESMAVLERQLTGSEHLQTLIFENNMVGPEGATHFAGIVGSCPSLTNIKYAQVRAGLAGARAVLQAIVDNTNLNLVSLDINGAKLFSDDQEDAIALLVQVITQNPNLKHLDIGDCELTDDGMNQLLPFLLGANLSLEFFNVCENELSIECCDKLADFLLQQQSTLCMFHAHGNEFTSQGVETLMGVYKDANDSRLENVDFSENQLGHRAAVALTQAALPNIQNVKLSGNGFSLRDVTRLEKRFGDALEEMEDNDEDAEFDDELEDEEIEEEVNEAPQHDDDDIDEIVAAISHGIRNAQI
jgi:Ran GTPase-activating protein 1